MPSERQITHFTLAKKSASALAEKYGEALHERDDDNLLLRTVNPFLMAGFKMAKDIVEPSFQRRIARGSMAKSGLEISLAAVRPGAVMLVGLAVVLEHSGIYLGDGMVAELHGSGAVGRVDLERFRLGADDDQIKLRMGSWVYVACTFAENGFTPLCHDEVAAIANDYVGQRVAYNLLVNNCHLFSATCVRRQKEFVPGDGLSTIEGLEDAIVGLHGIEKNMLYWIPVRISDGRENAIERIQAAKLDV